MLIRNVLSAPTRLPTCIPTGEIVTPSAPFTPADLTNLRLWLDATDINGNDTDDNPADTTAVSTWADKSGNNNDATQGTGASQPTMDSASVNGKDALLLDGTDDQLILTSATNLTGAFHIFIVAKNTTHSGHMMVMGPQSGTAKLGVLNGDFLFFRAVDDGSSATMAGPGRANDTTLFEVKRDASNVITAALDGEDFRSMFTDAGAVQFNRIGNGGGQEWDGHLCEFIVMESEATASERTNVLNRAASKWGVVLGG